MVIVILGISAGLDIKLIQQNLLLNTIVIFVRKPWQKNLNSWNIKRKIILELLKDVKNTNGTCKYGYRYCWFTHENSDKNNEIQIESNIQDKDNENGSVIKQLQNMVEKYTERIIKLENQMKKENYE